MPPELLEKQKENAPGIVDRAFRGMGNFAVRAGSRSEASALSQQEVAIEELFGNPETQRADLATATETLLIDANAAYDSSFITEKHLMKIGDKVLGKLGEYRDGLDEELELNPSGISGFESTVSELVKLFGRSSKDSKVTDDVARTTRLLQFKSKDRYTVHEKFVDKYYKELLGSRWSRKKPADVKNIQTLWRQPEFLSLMVNRFENNVSGHKYNWLFSQYEFIEKALLSFGFNQEEQKDLREAWDSFMYGDHKEQQQGRYINANSSLKVMSELMTTGSNTARDIYREFGIRHFGRYTSRLLLEQKRMFDGERPSDADPVALTITAVHDWNGSLREFHRRTDAVKPIYMEAGSFGEMSTALLRTKKYAGKISNLIIGGHGSKDGITLGEDERVDTSDIKKPATLRWFREHDFFTPDANIIFTSCNVGKKGGFAQTISEISGMDVFASPKRTRGFIKEDREHTGRYKVVLPNRSIPSQLLKLSTRRNSVRRYKAGKRAHNTNLALLD